METNRVQAAATATGGPTEVSSSGPTGFASESSLGATSSRCGLDVICLSPVLVFSAASCRTLPSPWRPGSTTPTRAPSSCRGCGPSMGTHPCFTTCWSSPRTVSGPAWCSVCFSAEFMAPERQTAAHSLPATLSLTGGRHMENGAAA